MSTDDRTPAPANDVLPSAGEPDLLERCSAQRKT